MLRNDETKRLDAVTYHYTHTYYTGLYSEPEGTALCVLEGHRGGVTHLKFSPDGMVLYSGGRKDPEILWYVSTYIIQFLVDSIKNDNKYRNPYGYSRRT
jgi:hypothetical protein